MSLPVDQQVINRIFSAMQVTNLEKGLLDQIIEGQMACLYEAG